MTHNELVEELPSFLKPTLRLFVSVDIVGSTAFKQSSNRPRAEASKDSDHFAAPWFAASTLFYREIERLFSTEWNVLSEQLRHSPQYLWPPGDKPRLWKAAGDELIYSKDLSDHRQALVCIEAWRKATERFRPELKKYSTSLDLKSTAWIAGFPVLNSELILNTSPTCSVHALSDDPVVANLQLLEAYQGSAEGMVRDFIGPSIDTGFRLAQFSTPRKFVVSVDLALLLAHTLVIPPEHDFAVKEFTVRYEGRHVLKGVLDGIPYPIFWIDTGPNDRLHELEDLFDKSQAIGFAELREYCQTFIARFGGDRLIKPYIATNTDPFFQTIPPAHQERLQKYVTYWKQELAKREVEDKSDREPDNYKLDSSAPSATEVLETIIPALVSKSDQGT